MNEQVSALTDEEVAAEYVSNVIVMMQSNRQAETAWSQYHLIGDVMRGAAESRSPELSSGAMLSQNFKQNLMQKLELEPTVLAPNAVLASLHLLPQRHRKVPVVWSIAASFAAVMFVGWMALQTSPELAPIEVAQQSVPTEYLVAHQVSAPSASSYYIQSVSYSE